MSSLKKYIAILAVMLLVLGLGVTHAQNNPSSATDSGANVSREAVSPDITFEGSQDSSLFVGHYRLNTGDSVKIDILTLTPEEYVQMIDEEGNVTLSVIGRVHIAGSTLTEARDELQKQVDKYFQNAFVTIEIRNLGKVKFYVYGDVLRPGFYTATGVTTVFDFLQNFGLTASGEHRRIVHVRGTPDAAFPVNEPGEKGDLLKPGGELLSELIETSLELFDEGRASEIDSRVTVVDPLIFTLQGQIEQRNFFLGYGDIIYVPDPATLVSLEGFKRSGHLEILPGETWTDVIRMAGKPDMERNASNIVLERHNTDGKLVQLYYNMNILDDSEWSQIPLQDRDILKVLPNETNVYVLGAVTNAGAYPYEQSSNILDYLALAGGPTSDAHLRFAIVLRPSSDPRVSLENSQVMNIDLGVVLKKKGKTSNVALQPGDIIFLPEKGMQDMLPNALSGLSVLINAIRLFP